MYETALAADTNEPRFLFMITKPTVLVLGAGASSHYGFPLGRELLDRVCALLENPTAFSAIMQAGFAHSKVDGFLTTLADAAYESVDWFLEDWPEYIPIGKAATATVLIPLEDPAGLRPPRATHEQHWYRDLLNVLDSDPARFRENQLSVVTFNYDRSLEHFLWTALKTRRTKSAGGERVGSMKAQTDLSSIEIVHVHGSLGAYPILGAEGRPYTSLLDGDAVREAADKIYVVGEAAHDAHGFKRARHLLEEATKILFLGFGFNEESVKRLGVFDEPWDEVRRQRTHVSATFQGIPAPRREMIEREILNGAVQVASMTTVCNFLREEKRLV